jgi:hypothetical protein
MSVFAYIASFVLCVNTAVTRVILKLMHCLWIRKRARSTYVSSYHLFHFYTVFCNLPLLSPAY